jgi:hypothetical protein
MKSTIRLTQFTNPPGFRLNLPGGMTHRPDNRQLFIIP